MTLLDRCINFGVCNFWLVIGATTHMGLKALRMVNYRDEEIWNETKADYAECMRMIFSK